MAKPRKKSSLRVKPKIFIFCEGETTEPEYIKAYIYYKYPQCTHLKRAERPVNIKDTDKNTPVQIVDVAVEFKKRLELKEDQVWVVYDRESPQKYSNELHQKAYKKAIDNDIKVAISNICFEYWLLLHVEDSTLSASSCNNLIESPAFRKFLKKINIENYSKKCTSSKKISTNLMTKKFLDNATSRAIKNNKQALKSANKGVIEPYKIQPYTDVYKLLRAIDEIANSF